MSDFDEKVVDRIKKLEREVERLRVKESPGAWANWTPTLTASTTNPTIGSGTLTGRYVAVGKLVIASVYIAFASDSNAGSGVWRISFPVTPTNVTLITGSWSINDVGTNNFSGAVRYSGATFVTFPYEGSPFYVSHNYPMTWANGDTLRATWIYEAA